jgi:hypothetical protein
MWHTDLLIHKRKILSTSSVGNFSSSFSWYVLLCLLGLVFCFSGCSSKTGGGFQIDVLAPQKSRMHQDFSQSYCSINDEGQITMVLRARKRIQAQDRIRTVNQTLVVNTFWRPERGLTPITASATNANIEYLIEMDSEMAWYRGAGFVQVKKKKFRRDQQILLRSSTIELNQYTTGFPVTFTKAKLDGKAHTTRDAELVKTLVAEFREKCRVLKTK